MKFLVALLILTGIDLPGACDDQYKWQEFLRGYMDQSYLFTVLGQNGTEIELWVSEANGGWTMLGIPATGQYCQIVTGTNWPKGQI